MKWKNHSEITVPQPMPFPTLETQGVKEGKERWRHDVDEEGVRVDMVEDEVVVVTGR